MRGLIIAFLLSPAGCDLFRMPDPEAPEVEIRNLTVDLLDGVLSATADVALTPGDGRSIILWLRENPVATLDATTDAELRVSFPVTAYEGQITPLRATLEEAGTVLVRDQRELWLGPELVAHAALKVVDERARVAVFRDQVQFVGRVPVFGEDVIAQAEDFLARFGGVLGLGSDPLAVLRAEEARESGLGEVVRFSVLTESLGVPVQGSSVRVRIADGHAMMAVATQPWHRTMPPPAIDAVEARRVASLVGPSVLEPALIAVRGNRGGVAPVWHVRLDDGASAFVDAVGGALVGSALPGPSFDLVVERPGPWLDPLFSLFICPGDEICDETSCDADTYSNASTARLSATHTSSALQKVSGQEGWVGETMWFQINQSNATDIARYFALCGKVFLAEGMECPGIIGHESMHAVGHELHGFPPLDLSATDDHGLSLEEHVGDVMGLASLREVNVSSLDMALGCALGTVELGLAQPRHACAWTDWWTDAPENPHKNKLILNAAIRLMIAGGTIDTMPEECGGGPASPEQAVVPVPEPEVFQLVFDAFTMLGHDSGPGGYAHLMIELAAERPAVSTCDVRRAFLNAGIGMVDWDCNWVADWQQIEPPELPDQDKDGVLDEWDNCPGTPNPDQQNTDWDIDGDVCDIDDDNDGVVDVDDNCPKVANPGQDDGDGNGVGDVCQADDGDGVPFDEDNCPWDHNPLQQDTDGDTIGNACDDDVDGDKLSNKVDLCNGVMSTNNADPDMDGRGAPCDNCPDDYNPGQGNCDGDAWGDICEPDTVDTDDDGVADARDVDADGVADEDDNCPCDFNPQQMDVCPTVPSTPPDDFDPDAFWRDPFLPARIPIPACDGPMDGRLVIYGGRPLSASLWQGPTPTQRTLADDYVEGSVRGEEGYQVLTIPVGHRTDAPLELFVTAPNGTRAGDPMRWRFERSCPQERD